MLQKQILSVPSSREEISEIPNFSSCALSVFLFWRKCVLHFYLSEQKDFFNSLNSFHISWVINLMMVELKLILKFLQWNLLFFLKTCIFGIVCSLYIHTWSQFTVYLNVSSALRSIFEIRLNFPLLIMIAEIVLNALTASAVDHTTISPTLLSNRVNNIMKLREKSNHFLQSLMTR